MQAQLAVLTVVLAFVWAPHLQAQVTVDFAKITCQQFLTDDVASSEYITAWLNGYYNGKRNNTVIDKGAMDKKVERLSEYCYKNRETPVMDAIKDVAWP